MSLTLRYQRLFVVVMLRDGTWRFCGILIHPMEYTKASKRW